MSVFECIFFPVCQTVSIGRVCCEIHELAFVSDEERRNVRLHVGRCQLECHHFRFQDTGVNFVHGQVVQAAFERSRLLNRVQRAVNRFIDHEGLDHSVGNGSQVVIRSPVFTPSLLAYIFFV